MLATIPDWRHTADRFMWIEMGAAATALPSNNFRRARIVTSTVHETGALVMTEDKGSIYKLTPSEMPENSREGHPIGRYSEEAIRRGVPEIAAHSCLNSISEALREYGPVDARSRLNESRLQPETLRHARFALKAVVRYFAFRLLRLASRI
jgi:hypothetical protein